MTHRWLEREAIKEALAREQNLSAAARALQVNRMTLRRRLDVHQIPYVSMPRATRVKPPVPHSLAELRALAGAYDKACDFHRWWPVGPGEWVCRDCPAVISLAVSR